MPTDEVKKRVVRGVPLTYEGSLPIESGFIATETNILLHLHEIIFKK
jgi:hypothetical protein